MGLGEKIKGAVKEKVGDAIDDQNLQAEGEAQQLKGEEEAKETADRAKAKAHEEKAEALQAEQDRLDG